MSRKTASDALKSNQEYSIVIRFHALKIRRGSPLVGVQLPLPAPALLGSAGYGRYVVTPLEYFGIRSKGGKESAHEQTRVRLEVRQAQERTMEILQTRRS